MRWSFGSPVGSWSNVNWIANKLRLRKKHFIAQLEHISSLGQGSLSGDGGELGGPLEFVSEAGELPDEARVGLVQRRDLLLLHQDHPLLLAGVRVLL